MDKLYYLVNWQKDKTRTWSGTCWGLFTSLQKYYDVEDIDAFPKDSVVFKILRRLKIVKSDMGLSNMLSAKNNLTPFLKDKGNINVFQFTDCIPASDSIKSWVYKDLTLSYVKYMHDNLPEVFKMSGYQRNDIHEIENKLKYEKEFEKSMLGTFCMGEWLRHFMIEHANIPANRVFTVGGGINLNVSDIKPSRKENNKILFVGRDFKRKGGFLVYEAFRELKKIKQDAELYVAGPSSNPILFPISGYYYLGDCNHKKLAHYFNICDIFCMPSYFEAYGLVFIEALTYGLPCIGRNCYEMPYFIEDGKTGLLINNDNPIELAYKMKRLLENETIKHNVLSKREWYIDNYSWDAVAERIYSIMSKAPQ